MKMAEYIERGKALQIIKDIMSDRKIKHKHRAINRNIKQMTAVDVAEVKHGKWIYHECVSSYEGAKSGYSCSNCCMIFDEEFYENSIFNYCPNCGARMGGEGE